MTPLSRWTIAVALCVASVAVAAVPAAAGNAASDEAAFVSKINGARADRGLPALRVASDLVAVARRHSAEMARSDAIYHNPALGSDVSNWEKLGENVGRGTSVAITHEYFMDSAEHRGNILWAEVTEVGVGVAYGGKWIYVTQIFRLPAGKSAPAAASPAGSGTARAAAPTTAPEPVRVAPPPKPRVVSFLVQLTLAD
ncbi:MAG TPA: CAP domain-containing protein [Actinomycetota bacterium]